MAGAGGAAPPVAPAPIPDAERFTRGAAHGEPTFRLVASHCMLWVAYFSVLIADCMAEAGLAPAVRDRRCAHYRAKVEEYNELLYYCNYEGNPPHRGAAADTADKTKFKCPDIYKDADDVDQFIDLTVAYLDASGVTNPQKRATHFRLLLSKVVNETLTNTFRSDVTFWLNDAHVISALQRFYRAPNRHITAAAMIPHLYMIGNQLRACNIAYLRLMGRAHKNPDTLEHLQMFVLLLNNLALPGGLRNGIVDKVDSGIYTTHAALYEALDKAMQTQHGANYNSKPSTNNEHTEYFKSARAAYKSADVTIFMPGTSTTEQKGKGKATYQDQKPFSGKGSYKRQRKEASQPSAELRTPGGNKKPKSNGSWADKVKGACNTCGKMGHWAADCRSVKHANGRPLKGVAKPVVNGGESSANGAKRPFQKNKKVTIVEVPASDSSESDDGADISMLKICNKSLKSDEYQSADEDLESLENYNPSPEELSEFEQLYNNSSASLMCAPAQLMANLTLEATTDMDTTITEPSKSTKGMRLGPK
jgi:hypothetical protein